MHICLRSTTFRQIHRSTFNKIFNTEQFEIVPVNKTRNQPAQVSHNMYTLINVLRSIVNQQLHTLVQHTALSEDLPSVMHD